MEETFAVYGHAGYQPLGGKWTLEPSYFFFLGNPS